MFGVKEFLEKAEGTLRTVDAAANDARRLLFILTGIAEDVRLITSTVSRRFNGYPLDPPADPPPSA